MSEPTEAQVKEFWEWCGFDTENVVTWAGVTKDAPLTLDNLFKYAVPKVVATDGYTLVLRTGTYQSWCHIVAHYAEYKSFYSNHRDPALALFWAIWEVMQDGK